MTDSTMLLYAIKLVLGGFTVFFAIVLWSKTRDMAWMALVGGVITSYAGIVFDLLCFLGIVQSLDYMLFGIPILTLVIVVVPSLFFILGFIVMIKRLRH